MNTPEEKQQTSETIDQEYTFHAAQAGHKANLVTLAATDIERLELEIKSHFVRMKTLNLEAQKLKAAKTEVSA